MTIADFKNKFKTICTQTYPDALDAWFEAVGQMHLRCIPIPADYDYLPGKADVIDEDCRFHKDFIKATNDEIIALARYITKYLRVLKSHGLDE